MNMRNPRIFVASSLESLDVADAINVNMDHKAEVTVWKNGFKLSTDNIDSLVKKATTVDFAIFVFTPDDITKIRGSEKQIVRDNVLFELGLFIGTLGKSRCFILKPRNIDLYFPTDLLGLTPADYEGNRSDGDLISAVNHPCILIKQEVAALGLISQDMEIQKNPRQTTNYNYKLQEVEHMLLIKILEKYADSPNGVVAWRIFVQLKQIDKGLLAIASVKLERQGYIVKSITTDTNTEMYTFSITADGIDYILENEDIINIVKLNMIETGAGDFNEDIPF